MPTDPIAVLHTALEKAREASVTAGWARGPDNRYVATETAAWQQVTDALAAVKRERDEFREALTDIAEARGIGPNWMQARASAALQEASHADTN